MATKTSIKISNGSIKWGVNILPNGMYYKEIDRDGKI
jgi:hypothetical protein